MVWHSLIDFDANNYTTTNCDLLDWSSIERYYDKSNVFSAYQDFVRLNIKNHPLKPYAHQFSKI